MPFFLVAAVKGAARARLRDGTRSPALHLPPGELAVAVVEELWLAGRRLAAPLALMTAVAVAVVFALDGTTAGPVLEGTAQAGMVVAPVGVTGIAWLVTRRLMRGRNR